MTERQLIRRLRREIEGMGCGCYRIKIQLCSACVLMKLIDDGLAEIGDSKTERLGPRRDDPPTASSRAVEYELKGR